MNKFKRGDKVKTINKPSEEHDPIGTHGIVSDGGMFIFVEIITYDENGKWFSAYQENDLMFLPKDEPTNLPDTLLA